MTRTRQTVNMDQRKGVLHEEQYLYSCFFQRQVI